MTYRSLVLIAVAGVLAACSPPRGQTATADAAQSVAVTPPTRPKVSQAEGTFVLASPLACTVGKDCFIQQYVDHDPAKDTASDYTCGHAVYDGHDGTDFRLPDKAAQVRGVAVLAVAPGVVIGLRDGEPDFAVGAFSQAAVDMDKACGNGVVIGHAGGWQTQYCHMRQGSVKVAKGQQVSAGMPLGLVGQSGDAQFVHLHLTVRHNGKPVDPFGTADACSGAAATTLWAPALRDQMAYAGRQVLNIGFAAGPVAMDDIERGGIAAPVRSSPALVLFVRAIDLRQGDVQTVTLYGPDGQPRAVSEVPALDRDKAQYMLFAGEKLKGATWTSGRYRGVYQVTDSAGRVVVRREATLPLP